MCLSTPSCSAQQSAEIQTALLQAITGLTQLVSQLATQFPTKPAAADAEPWMEEREPEVAQSTAATCTPNLTTLWDELSVKELRSFLRSFPIDRSSLPAAIERLRRSELIEALNQIQALDR
ncbi:MAG: hypothetical protein RLZZ54_205 [Cyanobacteriota bacterium]|jgi:DNA/RNA-binding domain of Phe-tRNA-synthetase-like protein